MKSDFSFILNDYAIRKILSKKVLVAIPIQDYDEKVGLENPLFKCIRLEYNNELKQYELTDRIEEVYDNDTESVVIHPI